MKTKILLADDHEIMRDGLRAMLEKEAGFEVAAVAGDGRETVSVAQEMNLDVILMDINMPNMNGLEATRQIKKQCPEVKVLTLSVHTDHELAADMIQAGASGYLPKSCAAKELVEAIHTVMKGHTYLSPKVTDSVFEYLQQKPPGEDLPSAILTSREREILQLIAEGKTTKEMSSHLNVSESTVEKHRQNITSKLGIRTVAELTKYAIRHGLTSLES